MRITDPPPHKRRVKHNRLHKPIPGAPEGFVLVRFIHAPGRISAAVNGDACLIPLHKQAGYPGQHIFQHLVKIRYDINLHIGNHGPGKLCGILRHVLLRYLHEGIHDLQHRLIFHEPVYKVER